MCTSKAVIEEEHLNAEVNGAIEGERSLRNFKKV